MFMSGGGFDGSLSNITPIAVDSAGLNGKYCCQFFFCVLPFFFFIVFFYDLGLSHFTTVQIYPLFC